LASSSTVSLVEQEPSTSSRSKVSRVALRSARSSCAAVTAASVVRTTSMVANEGASMPAPLAMPPKFHLSRWWKAASLGTVSVVMIACAASRPPERPPPISCTISVIAGITLSIGSRSPIKPVEQTAISPAPVSVPQLLSAAANSSAVRWASWNPPGPVQAFAPPELRMTARNRPEVSTCCDHSTGAAFT
jgi:hypothetical protein